MTAIEQNLYNKGSFNVAMARVENKQVSFVVVVVVVVYRTFPNCFTLKSGPNKIQGVS